MTASESVAVARTLQRGSLYTLLFLLPMSKAAIELAFPVLLASWVWELVLTRGQSSIWRDRRSRWCAAAVLAYVGVCALSIFTSDHRLLSLRGFVRKTLEYAGFFVVAVELGKEPRIVKTALMVVMASAWLVGLDAVAQELIGRDLFRGHSVLKYGRMTGPYESPIDLATYLIVALPITLAWVAAEIRSNARWRGWALAFLLSACVLRAGSRGAWVGLAGGLAILVMLVRRLRKAVLLGCVGAVVAVVLFQAGGRHMGWPSLPDVGPGDRLFMWESAWRMVQDRPVLGHGLNTFMANYLDYWVGGERQPRYAHNCFLQTAAETGVVGLAAFVGLLGVIAWCWLRAVRRVLAQDPVRWMLVGLGSGLLGFVIQSVGDTNFYALRQATLFWTLAGLMTGLALRTVQTLSPRSS